MKRLRNILIGIDMFLFFAVTGIAAERQIYSFSMGHMGGEVEAASAIAGDSGDKGSGVVPNSETTEKDPAKEVKRVALTFDDGPNPNHTEALLDGLKERGVKATFFLLGERVERFPEIVTRLYEEGHLIGCHGYEHVDLNKLTEEEALSQVTRTNDLIYQITGMYPEYIRPPYGSWKEDLDAQTFMVEVLWDIDTLDWSCKNEQMIVNSITSQVQDGDIILMHDAYDTTLLATFDIIEILRSQGYEFVTVDELIFE